MGRDAEYKKGKLHTFKDVIAKRSDLVEFSKGRMPAAPAGTTVVHNAGLVLGFANSGADAGLYKPYAAGNSDGSEVAVGVLAYGVEIDDEGCDSAVSVIKDGTLFKDMLIGLDAAAETALNATSHVDDGENLIRVRA